jgi:hypothetical protein
MSGYGPSHVVYSDTAEGEQCWEEQEKAMKNDNDKNFMVIILSSACGVFRGGVRVVILVGNRCASLKYPPPLHRLEGGEAGRQLPLLVNRSRFLRKSRGCGSYRIGATTIPV